MENTKEILKSIIILSILLTMFSCEKWNLTGIKGKGQVIESVINIDDIDGIELAIPATLYIEKGESQSIRIEAQQNIFDNIEKRTIGGVLELSFYKNVSRSEPIVIYTTLTGLKKLKMAGSGEIICDSEFSSSETVDINVCGSGEITANINAPKINTEISGSGNIKLQASCQRLNADIVGSGDIKLEEGSAEKSDIKISGSGDIFAQNFPMEDCEVEIIGSGNVKIYVTDNLYVKIIGSGDVFYKGTPRISSEIIGSGDIIKSH